VHTKGFENRDLIHLGGLVATLNVKGGATAFHSTQLPQPDYFTQLNCPLN
jgi:hypothetical protein